MPHSLSSHDSKPSTPFHLLSDDSASFVRRFSAILLGVWLGAILMIAVAAPAAFQSVDTTLKFRTPLVTQAIRMLGEEQVHDLLRYQVGEANRHMFETWGVLQLALGAVVFVLLLFFSHVRKTGLAVSLLMLLLAAGLNWVVIPRIVETGRVLHTAQSAQARVAMQQFRTLHTAFSTFEAAVAVLAVFLLVLLLRRRGGSRGGSRRGRRVSAEV